MKRVIRLFFVCLFFAEMVSFVGANPFTSSSGNKPDESVPVLRTTKPDEGLVQQQQKIRENLAGYFSDIHTKGSPRAFLLLLGASFLFGFFHALGPGHRKTIVFSLYIAKKAPVWEPAAVGLILSFLHAVSSIVLMLFLRGISGSISGKADLIGVYMEGFTWIFLIFFALFFVVQSIKEFFGKAHSAHTVSMSLGPLFLSGLYPCPGAILVLVLSLTLSMLPIGILSVIAMSLGMSVPIIVAGYLAWFGRTGLFYSFHKNEKFLVRLSSGIEVIGFLFLLFFALYMSYPFIYSVIL